jgi:hypothetical protein
LAKDLEDIQVAVDYLKSNYGYKVELVVGHSRGSIVAFRWLSMTKDGRGVPAFVNISGRYRMPVTSKFPPRTLKYADLVCLENFGYKISACSKTPIFIGNRHLLQNHQIALSGREISPSKVIPHGM